MKGDFSRFTHRPAKHYVGVRKQQGRVDLDADFNEYVDIQDYLDRTALTDVIRHSAAAAVGSAPCTSVMARAVSVALTASALTVASRPIARTRWSPVVIRGLVVSFLPAAPRRRVNLQREQRTIQSRRGGPAASGAGAR